MEHLQRLYSKGRLLGSEFWVTEIGKHSSFLQLGFTKAFMTQGAPGKKGLPGTNTLTYFSPILLMVTNALQYPPVPNVIKLFTTVI